MFDIHKFGFNTQEKVDEVSGDGNHNTALFWEYDTRLGRRWNRDPKPNPSISDYVCFGNNPILNSDLLGDTVKPQGKGAQQLYDDYKTTLKGKLIEYNVKLTSVTPGMQSDGEKAKLEEEYSEFIDANKELEEVESSEQIFEIEQKNDATVFGTAETRYNASNDHIIASVKKNADVGNLANEMKHFNQYIKGDISFHKSTGKAGILFDVTDEVAATRRENAFVGIKKTDDDIEKQVLKESYNFISPGRNLNYKSRRSEFGNYNNTTNWNPMYQHFAGSDEIYFPQK